MTRKYEFLLTFTTTSHNQLENVSSHIFRDIRKLLNTMFKSVFEEAFTVMKNYHGTNESKNISFSHQ